MNLKPELLDVLTALGVTPEEVDLLRERMLSAVTSWQAKVTALDAQIATLEAQRVEALAALDQGLTTVNKLGSV